MRFIGCFLVLLLLLAAPAFAHDSRVFHATAAPFNVVADGSTDNTSGLQAAIDSAEVYGTTVVLPPGKIKFTSQLTINSDGVMLQGAGGITDTPNDLTHTTVLWFDPPDPSSAPKGILLQDVVGCGFRDLNLNATIGDSGDFVTMEGCELCTWENVRLTFNASETSGLAGLTLRSVSNGPQCTNNRFYSCYFGMTGSSGAPREGYAVRLNCTGTEGNPAVTANSFVMCQFANAENPGSALRLDGSTDCPCANTRVMSSWFTIPNDGVDAGIDANNSDRNQFLGLTLDGDGSDVVMNFDSTCQQNLFVGAVDGSITDSQATIEDKATILDIAPQGGQGFALPSITLHRTGTPPANVTDGTVWVGSITGAGPDTMYVRLDGAWVRAAP